MNLIIFILNIFTLLIVSIESFKFNQLRIVGGISAEPNSAPYIVSFFVRDRRRQLIPFCSGTLLSESWILTAAHCLVIQPYRIHIAAGHHNQINFENTTQFRKADYYIQHENFNRIGPFDIGLLHVNRPFELTPQVQYVTLSGTGVYNGDATIYGWGSLLPSRKREFPNILQTANLTIIDNIYCNAIYPIEINDGNLCAGLPTLGKGGCVGDSGGPLIQNGLQIGIISWGPITCDPLEGPSVFTRVSYYITWIQKQLENATDILSQDNDDEDDEDDDESVNYDDEETESSLDFTTTVKVETETSEITTNRGDLINFE